MTFEDTPEKQACGIQDASNQAILPILFSWPSPGKTADYTGDEANLEWSENHSETLLICLFPKK
jgi:esterase/lipase superfamily enzyme